MAYSDYGGYAYRNGERVEDRSDYTITGPDGGYGLPGSWPGIAQIMEGDKNKNYPYCHVVLGDGPVFVGMYKQTSIQVYRGLEKLDLVSLVKDCPKEAIKEWGIDYDHFVGLSLPCHFEIDGIKCEIRWVYTDNYYQFVRMEQPDGNYWCGFSGYGVGAGLESGEHGFSTKSQIQHLKSVWPDAVIAKAA